MDNNKKAVLIVDGLPPSSRAGLFIKQLSSDFDVFYVSFVPDLCDINHESISALLKKNIRDILSSHDKFYIIAVSFGGYVIAHSNDTLSLHSGAIERIALYSPVARMEKVVGIETLPGYLKERYSRLNVSIEDLFKLDHELPTRNLLDGDLANITHIVLGSQDSQLPISLHRDYFRRYNTSITNEGHIGISSLVSRSDPGWM